MIIPPPVIECDFLVFPLVTSEYPFHYYVNTKTQTNKTTQNPNCPQLSLMFSVKMDYVRAFHSWSCWGWKWLIVLGMGVLFQWHPLSPHYVVSEGRVLAFYTSAFWYSLLLPSINHTSLLSVRCYPFISLVLIFKYSLNSEACTYSLHYCLVSPFPAHATFDKTQEISNP